MNFLDKVGGNARISFLLVVKVFLRNTTSLNKGLRNLRNIESSAFPINVKLLHTVKSLYMMFNVDLKDYCNLNANLGNI